MTELTNLHNSVAETPVAPTVLDVSPNSEQPTTDYKTRRRHARRIAAFALAARSLGLPLRALSFDLASLSDVIGDGHPPHVHLIAHLADEMAANAFNDYRHYNAMREGVNDYQLNDTCSELCGVMMPSLWDFHEDLEAYNCLENAFIQAVTCLVEQNLDVLEALTCNLLDGMSLAGDQAKFMVDAMRDIARTITKRMELSEGCLATAVPESRCDEE